MEDVEPRSGHSKESSKAHTRNSFVWLLIKVQETVIFFKKQAVREDKDS